MFIWKIFSPEKIPKQNILLFFNSGECSCQNVLLNLQGRFLGRMFIWRIFPQRRFLSKIFILEKKSKNLENVPRQNVHLNGKKIQRKFLGRMFMTLKGEPNWRSISGLISRNEVGNSHSSFALSFLSCLLITWHLKVMETWQLVLPFCAQQSASVTLQIRLACATRVSICHKPGFLCSSFVKSKQGRLLPKLRLKARNTSL